MRSADAVAPSPHAVVSLFFDYIYIFVGNNERNRRFYSNFVRVIQNLGTLKWHSINLISVGNNKIEIELFRI